MPFPFWLGPAGPDEARRQIQKPLFERLLRANPLKGICLNAGCGEGLFCDFLEWQDSIAAIVHLDLHGVSRVKQAHPGQCHRFVTASLTPLPLRDRSCESVMCTEVLEHIPDDEAAVSEMARVLKAGGVLLLSVPMPSAPFDPAHVREGYTLGQMTELLKRHGFCVQSHARGFHAGMRGMMAWWRFQERILPAGAPRMMPRFVAWLLAAMDRRFSLGKPWNLILVATRDKRL